MTDKDKCYSRFDIVLNPVLCSVIRRGFFSSISRSKRQHSESVLANDLARKHQVYSYVNQYHRKWEGMVIE